MVDPNLPVLRWTSKGRPVRSPRAVLYVAVALSASSDVAVQLSAAREYVERQQLELTATFIDDEASALLNQRPQLSLLLEGARHHALDVVIIDTLDRLGRDPTQVRNIVKALQRAGVELRTVDQGRVVLDEVASWR